MRNLLLILALLSAPAIAKDGYPVYGTLGRYTYKVNGATGFTVRYHDRTYLITNWHVCATWGDGSATNEARRRSMRSKVIKLIPKSDLCIATSDDQSGLTIGNDARVDMPVYVAGYPQYSRNAIQFRTGSTKKLAPETLDYTNIGCPKGFVRYQANSFTGETGCRNTQMIMDTSVEGAPGNSGSPVVNSKGQLVGVVHSSDGHTLNYIPVSSLVRELKLLEP